MSDPVCLALRTLRELFERAERLKAQAASLRQVAAELEKEALTVFEATVFHLDHIDSLRKGGKP
jgi:prefoldin subunit 5